MHKAIAFGKLATRVRQFHSTRYAAKLLIEKVPALGESITEGSIASWTKAVGDRVAVDDVIVIVETDKVTVDIKSTNAGVLTRKIATDTVSLVSGNQFFSLDMFSLKPNPLYDRLLWEASCMRSTQMAQQQHPLQHRHQRRLLPLRLPPPPLVVRTQKATVLTSTESRRSNLSERETKPRDTQRPLQSLLLPQ